MSTEEVKVLEMTCDGCGKLQWVPRGEVPVPWYQGNVIFHHGGGGSGGNWDACSKRCIVKAIDAVVTR